MSIIDAALFLVLEHVIGLCGLFEGALGIFVTGVLVRMVLQSQFLVGLLDITLIGIGRHPENIVVIPGSHPVPPRRVHPQLPAPQYRDQ